MRVTIQEPIEFDTGLTLRDGWRLLVETYGTAIEVDVTEPREGDAVEDWIVPVSSRVGTEPFLDAVERDEGLQRADVVRLLQLVAATGAGVEIRPRFSPSDQDDRCPPLPDEQPWLYSNREGWWARLDYAVFGPYRGWQQAFCAALAWRDARVQRAAAKEQET